jgi:sarcosine oxidase subunit beta
MLVAYRSHPPRSAELVIVGGGVVGAATAFYAARAGLRPLLLEGRPALASLTTPASTGAFRLQFDNREELELVRGSVELFTNFAEETGQSEYPLGVRQPGYLWLTTSREGSERQRRLVERQRSWGLDDVEVIDGDRVRQRFSYVAEQVVQARFRQADGFLDPKALTLGLAAGSDAEVVVSCPVTGFRLDNEGIAGVETSQGEVSTDTVVIAAGPLSGVVAARAGVELPITTVVRHKLVMPEVAEVPADAPMTIDEDTGAHWRPALWGAYLLFTDPDTPASPPTEEVPIDQGFVFRLLDPESPVSVARVSPFWREVWRRGNAHWFLQAGQYTMTADRRPLIGPTPVAGLWVNTGYSGHGIMGGPSGSRHLIEVMAGKVVPEANPFRLDRVFEERQHDVL